MNKHTIVFYVTLSVVVLSSLTSRGLFSVFFYFRQASVLFLILCVEHYNQADDWY